MSQNRSVEEFGQAEIDPAGEAIAGVFGTWRLTYRAGSKGLPINGRLRVHTDSDSDWGTPQFVDPAAAEYMTVEVPHGVQAVAKTTGIKSWEVEIHGRGLQAGEAITMLIGDTSSGSPGSRTQTFHDQHRYFWVDVDVTGDGNWESLEDPPFVKVIGDVAIRLVVVMPSTVTVGESFRVLLKAEDRWGNPSPGYNGAITLSGEGIEIPSGSIEFTAEDGGAKWVEGFQTTTAGTLKLLALGTAGNLSSTSNPSLSSDEPSEHRLLWADPHGGQLVLHSKIAEFFRYARDVAAIQFVGYQRNADAMSDEDWEAQQREEIAFYEPGRFIPIPGIEWSGRVWDGGHRNIYFRRHNQAAQRNLPAEVMFRGERGETKLPHVTDVYKEYRNADVIITPHVGGEHSDLTYHEPTLEPAVEISSSHGSFEWMLRDAIRRRYKLGFLGGSDSYTGRPGDDRPGYQLRRYSKAGLTGIYCKDVTLESFFEAMRARRVYATTGARIVASVKSDGHFMGSEYSTADAPTIAGSIEGTGPIESVELFRGLERIHTVPVKRQTIPNRVRILWNGSSRMTSYSGVVWDGVLNLSGAKITGIETIRFDSPRSHIVDCSDDCVRWHAWGCGYPMGYVLDLELGNDPELQIAVGTQTITGPAYGDHGSRPPRRVSFAPAEQAAICLKLDDLKTASREIDLGVLEKKLNVSLAREPGPSSAEFQFTDSDPSPGINPYWVRVIQSDMEMAWTSPVFVDYIASVS